MKYNKKIFMKYYGSLLIKIMMIMTLVMLISVLTVLIRTAFGLKFPHFFNICMGYCFSLYFVPLFPLALCKYIAMQKNAKLQRQYIKDGKLYVEICIKSGMVGLTYVNHWKKYTVINISSVNINKRYIIINGKILYGNLNYGFIEEKIVNKVKIPRVFDNEEMILKLGGVQNG